MFSSTNNFDNSSNLSEFHEVDSLNSNEYAENNQSSTQQMFTALGQSPELHSFSSLSESSKEGISDLSFADKNMRQSILDEARSLGLGEARSLGWTLDQARETEPGDKKAGSNLLADYIWEKKILRR
jgi:hypothetical protein